MARRYDHSRDEIRQLTLDHVKAFLEQSPVSELSLRTAAKLIGYTPGTIINVFGSYSEVLLAINAETLDELHARSQQAIQYCIEPTEGLQQLAMCYLQFARAHPWRWHLVFEHKMPDATLIPGWHQQRIDRMFALLDQLLQQLSPDKSQKQRHIASRVLWSGVHGICLLDAVDKLFSEQHSSGEEMILSLLDNYLYSWTLNKKADE